MVRKRIKIRAMKLISVFLLILLVTSCNRHIPGTKSLVEKISFADVNPQYSRLSKKEVKKHLPFILKVILCQ
jgi:hypothetical protein